MRWSGLSGLVAVTSLASFVHSQAVWDENQISTWICQWPYLRAAVVRDTVYLDGGQLYWQPTFAGGTVGQATFDDNPLGLAYTLNFSNPFNTTQNISAVLGHFSKAGSGAATNLAPNYYDGALLGNDYEFFLFGGLLERTDAYTPPPGDSVQGYRIYESDHSVQILGPSLFNYQLPAGMNRYVAYGGAASAPSENLAWYFSGLRNINFTEINLPSSDKATQADVVSNTFVTIDLAKQRSETFKNVTLDPSISGRAGSQLVWVPVGRRGILVALGGVVYPDFVNNTDAHSSNATESKRRSPEFMSTIDIYDVDGGKWYRQPTSGGPGQSTLGCAVVAPAQDGSSFNIYYYGGYDGLDRSKPFSDEMWVLSLPSFTWVKLASSNEEGRAGHKCVMPYPDQMMVIGGYQSTQGISIPCLPEVIRIFNLSTGKWMDRYDPAVYANYTVPQAVHDKIGGTGTGGATATTPSPSGWATSALARIFETTYPASKITNYYPYPSVGPTDNTNPNFSSIPVPEEGGGGVPSYLAPVLGSVLGLVFVTMIAVLILLYRRRRLLRGGTMSEAGTEDTNGHRIKSWLRGQPSEAKAPTEATFSYSPVSSTEVESVGVPPQSIAEMMNTEVHMPVELADTSPPAELHDNNHASQRGSLNNGSFYASGGTEQIDHAIAAALISAAPTATPSPPPPPPPIPHDESPIFYRPDSDALGNAPLPSGSTTTSPTSATTAGPSPRDNKVLSGISNLSERDRSHLRQISDTTVSSVTTAPLGGGNGGGNGHGGGNGFGNMGGVVESPAVVSPPTAGPVGESADYLSAQPLGQQGQGGQGGQQPPPGSPLRRSVFVERREDMNGDERRS